MDYSRDVAIPAVSAEYPVRRSQPRGLGKARSNSVRRAPLAEATAAADADTATGGSMDYSRDVARSASGGHSNGRADAGCRW
jgi:hypothetical protein